MAQYIQWPSRVTSLNGLTGNLTLVAGSNITITPSGQNITISATGGGGSGFNTIGTFDTGTASSDGLNAASTTLFAQSASATNPGMVNTSAQSFAGDKTFSGNFTLSALTANRALITFTGGLITTSATTSTEIGYVSGVTSAIQTQLNGKQATLTIGNLTDVGTDGIVVTSGTGAVIGSGTSLAQHVADSTHNGYLSSTDWSTFNGKQASGNYITALTGDATAAGPGSAALTLATVNSNVGSFGSSTAIPSVTVNGKGLVTAASTNVVIAPAGTLTGTTLAATVVSSSLTSVGTITTGVWTGTTIAVANGGTGQTSYTNGQLLIGNTSGNTLAKATLTAGTGVTITNGASAITVTASPISPSIQKFTSGSGTYTLPTSPSPIYLKITMVGAGSGGSGSGTTPGNGGVGGNTTFGSSLLAANGGGATSFATGVGGTGGTASLGTGPIGLALTGGAGSGVNNAVQSVGGNGGVSPLGGGGVGSGGGSATAGGAAVTNSGSGGGGPGSGVAANAGVGGGSGGYVHAIINSPSSTYAYAVGASGTAGTAGTGGQAGGAGGSGVIVVEEHYQ